MLEKLPEGLRAFDDAKATRNNIYSYSMEAIKNRFPLENDLYRVDLHDPEYHGQKEYTLSDQKKAILNRIQPGTPIRGRLTLTDKSNNKVVDETTTTIARVPFYTDRGTIINNGSEYSIINQHRLSPGTYTRIRTTGDVETQFNVLPGTGRGFRVGMDPDTGRFSVRIGASNTPAYEFFKAMGITDQEMVDTWGREVWDMNASHRSTDAIKRIYTQLAGSQSQEGISEDDMAAHTRDILSKYKLDPRIVKRNLGVDSDTVTPRVLLRSSQKILNIAKGDEDEDDRDSPRYKTWYGPEDLLRERIDRDSGNLSKNLLHKITRSKSLKPFYTGSMSEYFRSFLLGSGLTLPLEESNPLHYLEQMSRVTGMGVGGIGSEQAVTDSARDISPNQLGFLGIVEGPESGRIGIDARFSYGTYKGNDGKIYGKFTDAKTGKERFMDPGTVSDMTLGFSSFPQSKDKYVYAIKNGRTTKVPREEVDVYLPSMARMFSQGVNINNMPTGMQAARQFYAAKFTNQFLPLVNAEAPLVDTLVPGRDDLTFRQYYGRKSGTLNSGVDGVVTKVTDDKITVKGSDGETYGYDVVKDFPFNRLSYISYYPTVKAGDKVSAGDMLARSNFTDESGSMNLGVNLRAAMIPARGRSHDDAIVISESAARKLAAERMYGFDLDTRDGAEFGVSRYRSMFPETFNKEQYETLDENGIVKSGTVLNKGDPIILAVGPKLMTAGDAMLGKLHKTLRNSFIDKSVVWDHDYPGRVVDAVNIRGKAANVNVVSSPPVAVGDKLSSDFAIKGVVGTIMGEDDESDTGFTVGEIRSDLRMPQNSATGEPYEIMINPMAILSRVSPNQIISMALAKVAKKTGKPIRLPQDPPEEGWANYAKKILEENQVKDTSDIHDPVTGKTIKDIGDGYIYMSSFHHLSEHKLSARGGGGGYDSSFQPAKGGSDGAKRISGLNMSALLAHGVPDVIKDAIGIRGTANEEFWNRLRSGDQLPVPGVPFIYDKFLNSLRAGGINVLENGSKTQILPMTDKAIGEMAKYEINSSDMLDENFRPRPGGLFDEGLTGGTEGTRWSYIKLDEAIPNPIMEEPVRRVLGLKVKELQDVISGTKEINGRTGGEALHAELSAINPKEVLEKAIHTIKTSRGANRDNAVKVASYMDSAIKNDIHPSEWLITKVPVLPPVFRPVSRLGDMALVADINELYKDLLEVRNSTRSIRNTIGDKGASKERLDIYNAVRAAYGLGEPITPEGQSSKLKGALRQVVGDNPKTGMFQRRVVSKTVDNVSRGVIVVDPNLDMDTVGIPVDSAWNTYKDLILRGLSRNGYSQIRARELWESRHPAAKSILDKEMRDRPLILDRAPTWHKFNLMAFKPVLVEGNAIHMSPLPLKGFNADLDGDYVINRILVRVTGSIREDLIKKIGFSDGDKVMNRVDVVARDDEGFVTTIDIEDFPRGSLKFSKDGEKGRIDFHDVPDGIEVAAYDESTGVTVWAKPTIWSRHYDREVEIVNLSDGSQIYTDDDPRAVYGIPIDSDTLEPERFTPTYALDRIVAVPKTDTTDHLGSGSLTTITDGTLKGTGAYPFDLTFETGQMMGILVGDGWWSKKPSDTLKRIYDSYHAIYLADSEGYQHDYLVSVLRDNFGDYIRFNRREMLKKKLKGRYGDTVKYGYYFPDADKVCNFFTHQLGGVGDEKTSGCGNKHLPHFFLSACEEFRKGLVCGLIATDGTINSSYKGDKGPYLSVAFCTTSFRLAIETRLLLLSLGVGSSITGSQSSTSGNPCWYVNISVVDLKATDILDGLCNKRKMEKFVSVDVLDITNPRKARGVVITGPLVKDLKNIIPANTDSSYNIKSIRSTLERISDGGLVTRRMGNIIGRVLRDLSSKDPSILTPLVEKWLTILDSGTGWVLTQSMEKTGIREDGYDLTVPGYDTFASAEGVVLSNTMTYHIPITDKAVKNAREKMMPSKNLIMTTNLREPIHTPKMEMTLGLYNLTKEPSKKRTTVFSSSKEAVEAYRKGLIKANDPIEIRG